MFFLIRSAICIGLVVAALPDDGHAPRWPGASAPPVTTVALTSAEKLCRAAPGRCLALLREGLKAGSSEAYLALASRTALAPSRDSLSNADRRPAWNGPEVASD
jgi:hypothetical protein